MITVADGYHTPVLLGESIDGLKISPNGTYLDVTFGGGGHSKAIYSRLGAGGRLFSFDQDADAEANIEQLKDGRSDAEFVFVRSNFRYLSHWMRYYGVEQIDGLMADLGVSSHHFDDESRGFSFRFDAPLDMRMNKRAGRTAADVVNGYTERQLADILRLYGEMGNANRVAALLVKARTRQPLLSTRDLLGAAFGLKAGEGEGLETNIDPRVKKEAARLFQALRIEVNQEMAALREMLDAAVGLLKPGGRLVVITYHSLEDRMVKNIIKTGNAEGHVEKDFYGRVQAPLRAVTRQVITATADEQGRNPRSRSAKLRIGEKDTVATTNTQNEETDDD